MTIFHLLWQQQIWLNNYRPKSSLGVVLSDCLYGQSCATTTSNNIKVVTIWLQCIFSSYTKTYIHKSSYAQRFMWR